MTKIDESIEILTDLGLPRDQQNERSALTLLSLLDLKEKDKWSSSKKRNIRIHDILLFIDSSYAKKYAENTRETIRRQTLHQFIQAGIVVINEDEPGRSTNSPKTVYCISNEALNVIKKYSSEKYKEALDNFIRSKGKLVEKYAKTIKDEDVAISLPSGREIEPSPGPHNQLQKQIVEILQPRLIPNTKLLYIGDTKRKMLFIDKATLEKLKIPITKHDKLPDVVLYDEKKKMLFLIEAVTSHGPISPKRQMELEESLTDTDVRRVYISVFPDFHEFKKHIDNVAWETEVWIASNPDHMIHFNGEQFLTVYERL